MSTLSAVAWGFIIVIFGACIWIAYLLYEQPRATQALVPVVSVASSTAQIKTTTTTATSTDSVTPRSSSISTSSATKAPVLPPQILPTNSQQPSAPLMTTAPTPPSTVSSAPAQPIEVTNAAVRASLVNILCTTKAGGTFRPISGSGVIIDSRGIILTNAHVGQFFLLKDYLTEDNVDCVVRTGSPATAKYRAELLYLPEQWVRDNANQLSSAEATGTGENDYAFLLITSTTNGTSLPASFPALPLSLVEPSQGDAVMLAAYPAQFLGGATIQENLYASSAVTTIENIYTFASSTIDVLSLGNTVVSQSGSSGGAVVREQDGHLIGIIATATEGTTTATRNLNGITLAHINRSLNTFGKGGIAALLQSGDIRRAADTFTTVEAPNLAKELTDALKNK